MNTFKKGQRVVVSDEYYNRKGHTNLPVKKPDKNRQGTIKSVQGDHVNVLWDGLKCSNKLHYTNVKVLP